MHLSRKNSEKRERKQREREAAERKKQDDAHLKREIHHARLETRGLVPPRFDPTAPRTPARFDSAAGRTPWPFKNEQTGSVGTRRYNSLGDQSRAQNNSQSEDPDANTPLPPLSSSLPTNTTPPTRMTPPPPAQSTPPAPVTPKSNSPTDKPKGFWDRLSPLSRKKSTTEPTARGGIKSTWIYHTLPRSWKSRHHTPSKGKGKTPATTPSPTADDDNPFRDNEIDYSSDTENPFNDDRYATLRRSELPEEWSQSHTVPEERERYSRYMHEDDGYWNDPDNLDGPVLEQWALAHRTLVEEFDPCASRRSSKRVSTNGLTWN